MSGNRTPDVIKTDIDAAIEGLKESFLEYWNAEFSKVNFQLLRNADFIKKLNDQKSYAMNIIRLIDELNKASQSTQTDDIKYYTRLTSLSSLIRECEKADYALNELEKKPASEQLQKNWANAKENLFKSQEDHEDSLYQTASIQDVSDDDYKILSIHKGATTDEIKKAYRKLAFTEHPDKHNGSKEANDKFAIIAAAFQRIISKQTAPVVAAAPAPSAAAGTTPPAARMPDEAEQDNTNIPQTPLAKKLQDEIAARKDKAKLKSAATQKSAVQSATVKPAATAAKPTTVSKPDATPKPAATTIPAETLAHSASTVQTNTQSTSDSNKISAEQYKIRQQARAYRREKRNEHKKGAGHSARGTLPSKNAKSTQEAITKKAPAKAQTPTPPTAATTMKNAKAAKDRTGDINRLDTTHKQKDAAHKKKSVERLREESAARAAATPASTVTKPADELGKLKQDLMRDIYELSKKADDYHTAGKNLTSEQTSELHTIKRGIKDAKQRLIDSHNTDASGRTLGYKPKDELGKMEMADVQRLMTTVKELAERFNAETKRLDELTRQEEKRKTEEEAKLAEKEAKENELVDIQENKNIQTLIDEITKKCNLLDEQERIADKASLTLTNNQIRQELLSFKNESYKTKTAARNLATRLEGDYFDKTANKMKRKDLTELQDKIQYLDNKIEEINTLSKNIQAAQMSEFLMAVGSIRDNDLKTLRLRQIDIEQERVPPRDLPESIQTAINLSEKCQCMFVESTQGADDQVEQLNNTLSQLKSNDFNSSLFSNRIIETLIYICDHYKSSGKDNRETSYKIDKAGYISSAIATMIMSLNNLTMKNVFTNEQTDLEQKIQKLLTAEAENDSPAHKTNDKPSAGKDDKKKSATAAPPTAESTKSDKSFLGRVVDALTSSLKSKQQLPTTATTTPTASKKSPAASSTTSTPVSSAAASTTSPSVAAKSSPTPPTHKIVPPPTDIVNKAISASAEKAAELTAASEKSRKPAASPTTTTSSTKDQSINKDGGSAKKSSEEETSITRSLTDYDIRDILTKKCGLTETNEILILSLAQRSHKETFSDMLSVKFNESKPPCTVRVILNTQAEQHLALDAGSSAHWVVLEFNVDKQKKIAGINWVDSLDIENNTDLQKVYTGFINEIEGFKDLLTDDLKTKDLTVRFESPHIQPDETSCGYYAIMNLIGRAGNEVAPLGDFPASRLNEQLTDLYTSKDNNNKDERKIFAVKIATACNDLPNLMNTEASKLTGGADTATESTTAAAPPPAQPESTTSTQSTSATAATAAKIKARTTAPPTFQLTSKPTNMTNEQDDISTHPTVISKPEKGKQVTKGDLHGNALNFLHFLVKEGIVKIEGKEYGNLENDNSELYMSLRNLFYTSIYLDYQTLSVNFDEDVNTDIDKRLASLKIPELEKKFHEFINKIEKYVHVVNPLPDGFVVRLIGDELADRGVCDYFTLLLMEKLVDAGVQFESIYSNHGIEFIEAMEDKSKYHADGKYNRESSVIKGKNQILSLENTQDAINRGWITREKLNNLYEKAYKPNFKLLSYTLSHDQKSITLYTHAPVGTQVIEGIAHHFNIKYKASTAKELAETIDKINQHFKVEYVEKNKIKELCNDKLKDIEVAPSNRDILRSNIQVNPFALLMWHRISRNDPSIYDANVDRKRDLGFNVSYVHGHDGKPQLSTNNVFNLNENYMGRFATTQGTYAIATAHGTTAPSAALQMKPVVAQEIPAAQSAQKTDLDAAAASTSTSKTAGTSSADNATAKPVADNPSSPDDAITTTKAHATPAQTTAESNDDDFESSLNKLASKSADKPADGTAASQATSATTPTTEPAAASTHETAAPSNESLDSLLSKLRGDKSDISATETNEERDVFADLLNELSPGYKSESKQAASDQTTKQENDKSVMGDSELDALFSEDPVELIKALKSRIDSIFEKVTLNTNLNNEAVSDYYKMYTKAASLIEKNINAITTNALSKDDLEKLIYEVYSLNSTIDRLVLQLGIEVDTRKSDVDSMLDELDAISNEANTPVVDNTAGADTKPSTAAPAPATADTTAKPADPGTEQQNKDASEEILKTLAIPEPAEDDATKPPEPAATTDTEENDNELEGLLDDLDHIANETSSSDVSKILSKILGNFSDEQSSTHDTTSPDLEQPNINNNLIEYINELYDNLLIEKQKFLIELLANDTTLTPLYKKDLIDEIDKLKASHEALLKNIRESTTEIRKNLKLLKSISQYENDVKDIQSKVNKNKIESIITDLKKLQDLPPTVDKKNHVIYLAYFNSDNTLKREYANLNLGTYESNSMIELASIISASLRLGVQTHQPSQTAPDNNTKLISKLDKLSSEIYRKSQEIFNKDPYDKKLAIELKTKYEILRKKYAEATYLHSLKATKNTEFVLNHYKNTDFQDPSSLIKKHHKIYTIENLVVRHKAQVLVLSKLLGNKPYDATKIHETLKEVHDTGLSINQIMSDIVEGKAGLSESAKALISDYLMNTLSDLKSQNEIISQLLTKIDSGCKPDTYSKLNNLEPLLNQFYTSLEQMLTNKNSIEAAQLAVSKLNNELMPAAKKETASTDTIDKTNNLYDQLMELTKDKRLSPASKEPANDSRKPFADEKLAKLLVVINEFTANYNTFKNKYPQHSCLQDVKSIIAALNNLSETSTMSAYLTSITNATRLISELNTKNKTVLSNLEIESSSDKVNALFQSKNYRSMMDHACTETKDYIITSLNLCTNIPLRELTDGQKAMAKDIPNEIERLNNAREQLSSVIEKIEILDKLYSTDDLSQAHEKLTRILKLNLSHPNTSTALRELITLTDDMIANKKDAFDCLMKIKDIAISDVNQKLIKPYTVVDITDELKSNQEIIVQHNTFVNKLYNGYNKEKQDAIDLIKNLESPMSQSDIDKANAIISQHDSLTSELNTKIDSISQLNTKLNSYLTELNKIRSELSAMNAGAPKAKKQPIDNLSKTVNQLEAEIKRYNEIIARYPGSTHDIETKFNEKLTAIREQFAAKAEAYTADATSHTPARIKLKIKPTLPTITAATSALDKALIELIESAEGLSKLIIATDQDKTRKLVEEIKKYTQHDSNELESTVKLINKLNYLIEFCERNDLSNTYQSKLSDIKFKRNSILQQLQSELVEMQGEKSIPDFDELPYYYSAYRELYDLIKPFKDYANLGNQLSHPDISHDSAKKVIELLENIFNGNGFEQVSKDSDIHNIILSNVTELMKFSGYIKQHHEKLLSEHQHFSNLIDQLNTKSIDFVKSSQILRDFNSLIDLGKKQHASGDYLQSYSAYKFAHDKAIEIKNTFPFYWKQIPEFENNIAIIEKMLVDISASDEYRLGKIKKYLNAITDDTNNEQCKLIYLKVLELSDNVSLTSISDDRVIKPNLTSIFNDNTSTKFILAGERINTLLNLSDLYTAEGDHRNAFLYYRQAHHMSSLLSIGIEGISNDEYNNHLLNHTQNALSKLSFNDIQIIPSDNEVIRLDINKKSEALDNDIASNINQLLASNYNLSAKHSLPDGSERKVLVKFADPNSNSPIHPEEARIQALRYMRGMLLILNNSAPIKDKDEIIKNMLSSYNKIHAFNSATAHEFIDALARQLAASYNISIDAASSELSKAKNMSELLEEHPDIVTCSENDGKLTIETASLLKISDQFYQDNFNNLSSQPWFQAAEGKFAISGWASNAFTANGERLRQLGVPASSSARWLPQPSNAQQIETYVVSADKPNEIVSSSQWTRLGTIGLSGIGEDKPDKKVKLASAQFKEVADAIKKDGETRFKDLYSPLFGSKIKFPVVISYQTLMTPHLGEEAVPSQVYEDNNTRFINLTHNVINALSLEDTSETYLHTNAAINAKSGWFTAIKTKDTERTELEYKRNCTLDIFKEICDYQNNKGEFQRKLNLDPKQFSEFIKNKLLEKKKTNPAITDELINEIERRAYAYQCISKLLSNEPPYNDLKSYQRNLMLAALEYHMMGSQAVTIAGCKSARDRTAIFAAAVKTMQENPDAMHDWKTLNRGIKTSLEQGHHFRAMSFHCGVAKIDKVHQRYFDQLSPATRQGIKANSQFTNKHQGKPEPLAARLGITASDRRTYTKDMLTRKTPAKPPAKGASVSVIIGKPLTKSSPKGVPASSGVGGGPGGGGGGTPAPTPPPKKSAAPSAGDDAIINHLKDNIARYQNMAEFYAAAAERAAKSVQGDTDLAKFKELSTTMRSQIEVYKAHLETLSPPNNNHLNIIKNILRNLDEVDSTNKQTNVAHFSHSSQVVNCELTTSDKKILYDFNPTFAASSSVAGGISSELSPKIAATEAIGNKARVSQTTINTKGFLGKQSSTDVYSVQRTKDGAFVSNFHVNKNAIKKFNADNYLQWAVVEVENFRAANPDPGKQIIIKGNMPPKLVKEIATYCASQGYNYKITVAGMQDFVPTEKDIKSQQQRLAKNKPTIFGSAEALATPAKEVSAFNEQISKPPLSGSGGPAK